MMKSPTRKNKPTGGRKDGVFGVRGHSRLVWSGALVVLVTLCLVDVFSSAHHDGIHWESIPVFMVIYSFVSCLALIVAAKLLAMVLGRREDYYE